MALGAVPGLSCPALPQCASPNQGVAAPATVGNTATIEKPCSDHETSGSVQVTRHGYCLCALCSLTWEALHSEGAYRGLFKLNDY